MSVDELDKERRKAGAHDSKNCLPVHKLGVKGLFVSYLRKPHVKNLLICAPLFSLAYA
jgi:hypothetical protein